MQTHSYVSTRHLEAGTASYMAPECFIGEGVNEKIDVYSLAMLLWECVTGERPWKGHNMMQVAYQVRRQCCTDRLPARPFLLLG